MSDIKLLLASEHFGELTKAYKFVGNKTWLADDFDTLNLESSRQLFEQKSLESRTPRPKPLTVYALLSGLPFDATLVNPICDIQKSISTIIGDVLQYWVMPHNLGLEYCVFKWPDGNWNEVWRLQIEKAISQVNLPAYRFDIRGIQINPDGCVVARGFDHNRTVFKIRDHMRVALPFSPARQSSWAHVPLGRILEPVGKKTFHKLESFIQSLDDKTIASTQINTLRFIYETRWYMEERETLSSHSLRQIGGTR